MNNIQEQLRDVMHRIPVLRQEQLETYMCRVHGYHTSKVRDAIFSAGKVGRLLVSRNGYVTTKEYLSMIQNWEGEPKMNEFSYCRLEELSPYQRFLDQIDCFWIVLDMLDESDRFFVSGGPYPIQFVKSNGEKFVQVTRMRKESELSLPLLLRSLPWPEDGWRDRLQRIAVVDSPAAASLVPRTGFTHICMIDESEPDRIRLIQRRDGEAVWVPSQSLS